MNKINIAELLRECPKGMELDCTMFKGLEFDGIADNEYLPIRCRIKNPKGGYTVYNFTKYGCWIDTDFAKCVIFPKGKTTWEGFVPPCQFKDGDVLVHTQNERFVMSIYKSNESELIINTYAIFWDREEGLSVGMQICCYTDSTRFATEEEKQKLFQTIKDNGYKWNPETKTLEKLVKPIFKVSDRIKHKDDKNNTVITITGLKHDYYYIQYYNNIKNEYQNEKLFFTDQDKFELVINKFNINTLKPFESKVLVRHSETGIWMPAIFGGYDIPNLSYYVVGGTWWKYCIPYKGNGHLLGTTNDCDDFYKTWEK